MYKAGHIFAHLGAHAEWASSLQFGLSLSDMYFTILLPTLDYQSPTTTWLPTSASLQRGNIFFAKRYILQMHWFVSLRNFGILNSSAPVYFESCMPCISR